ncbi:MAG: hypothetical protein ABIH56_03595 [Candidatus Margulisiibacteriota bacterium]
MKRAKKTLIFVLLAVCVCTASYAASPPVRLKDIARVLEARDNQLMGFWPGGWVAQYRRPIAK